MSTEIGHVRSTDSPDMVCDAVYVTRFGGGSDRGQCAQITIGERYVQLDAEGVSALRRLLTRAMRPQQDPRAPRVRVKVPPARAVRTCPDCGEKRTVLAENVAQARDGVTRRCRSCQCKHLHAQDTPKREPAPRDDIDEVAVDRLMGGDKTVGNIAERIEAAIRLRKKGLTLRLISERIGVSHKTIDRYMQEARTTGRLAHRLVDWSDKAAAA